MLEKVELRLVGNDDSGPEDALDDLDLECGACLWLRRQRFYRSRVVIPYDVPVPSTVWAGYFECVIAGFFLVVEGHIVTVNRPFLHSVGLAAVLAEEFVRKL